MRIRRLVAAAIVASVGLATAASSTSLPAVGAGAAAPDPRAVAASRSGSAPDPPAAPIGTVGLVPPAPRPPRTPRTATTAPPAVRPPAPPGLPVPERPAPVADRSSPLHIPEIVLNAYRAAELQLAVSEPGCGLPWHLLAGIGRIESGHADGGHTDDAGTTVLPIRGPVRDHRSADNTHTDQGKLDEDPDHDRTVGPMQLLPAVWAEYGTDGNADGVADPDNIFDAALAAGRYLCSGNLNLRETAQQIRAVRRYRNSAAYVTDVLAWSVAYRQGAAPRPGAASALPVPPFDDHVDGTVDGTEASPDRVPPASRPGPSIRPAPTPPPAESTTPPIPR